MSLRVRRLSLRVQTAAGQFGVDLTLTDGLNIIWGDNTKGKSTCLQSLVYVLGLERMLSPRRTVPLPYVMTTRIDDPTTGQRHTVLESSVYAEIQNTLGRTITIRRGVVSKADNRLVSVFDGPLLSNAEGRYRQRDFYVLDPGAAQHEAGFHRMLADFIGWTLPRVSRYDGSEVPLYLEAIFPLVYVEQKAGWSAIPAAFPTFFQIRDVSRRAIEFLMNLETHSLELTRQRLQIEIATVKSAWRVQRDALLSVAASVNGAVESVPTEPVATPQDLNRAHLRVPLVDRWLAIAEMAEDLRKRIDELVTGETALVGPEASSQADQIAVLTEQVSEHNRRRNEIFRAKVREQMQRSSLEYRQQSLDEDLQKNLDAQKLRNFGSVISDAVAPDHCPTCAQPLADTLDAQKPGLDVMPVEANIEYIKAQRDIFRRLRERNESALHEFDRQLAAATAELNDAAARLRAVKADLVAPAQAPSVAAIDERIRAEVKLQAILEASDKFDEQIVLLTELSGRFAQLLAAQDALPLERLSNADKDKIQLFERLIQSQLSAYGFTTFAAEELNISEDSYRPQKEGFEIGFELSASDAIRLKWSYQLALLELSGSKKTNHPGVVVFDEPRQQETAKISFKRLLERAADSKRMGHQVIFATSEDRDELERFVDGLDCHFIAFEGYLIQRIQ